jgi:hypothetical protein
MSSSSKVNKKGSKNFTESEKIRIRKIVKEAGKEVFDDIRSGETSKRREKSKKTSKKASTECKIGCSQMGGKNKTKRKRCKKRT